MAYDDKALAPEALERQIRSYHAVRELIEEWDLGFVGIKGQPEPTNSFCTMDLAEAFLSDPYDREGAHEPIICATEADSEGALTIQISKELAGTLIKATFLGPFTDCVVTAGDPSLQVQVPGALAARRGERV